MALPSLKTCIIGYCFADVNLNQCTYSSFRLGVLKNLCSDIILSQDFQKQHKSVIFEFGGKRSWNFRSLHQAKELKTLTKELKLPKFTPGCAFSAASIEEPSLFTNLIPGYPIASKSRHFSKEDQKFIQQGITKLLSEGIIEPSVSPWRAQVVFAKDPLHRHKKWFCVDYSQTINQYTELMHTLFPALTTWSITLHSIKSFLLLILRVLIKYW